MRTKKRYVCEICGYESSDDARVLECEEAHILPVKILETEGYQEGIRHGDTPPAQVVVKFSNESKYYYALTDRKYARTEELDMFPDDKGID